MYIKVRVFPGTKKEVIKKLGDNKFEMQVREPAERNLANKRIQDLLAIEFGVTKSQVRLVTGHRSATKIFDVVTN